MPLGSAACTVKVAPIRLWQALERVAAACRAAGIHWAILPRDADTARRCVALGCRMLSLVRRGLKDFQLQYADFFAR